MASDSPAAPDFAFEARALSRGLRHVAGVDEAGRGPLAGPVVVAAVILDPDDIPAGLDDSKALSPARREALFVEIHQRARAIAVVAAPPRIIAAMNILQSTLWGMRRAVLGLHLPAEYVLIDGNRLPKGLPCPAEAIVGGDARCVSIAAASIVAKVTRDRMCAVMHAEEPQFGFDSHKGYGAPAHLAALDRHGPGRHHRMDFAPCAAAAARQAIAEEA